MKNDQLYDAIIEPLMETAELYSRAWSINRSTDEPSSMHIGNDIYSERAIFLASISEDAEKVFNTIVCRPDAANRRIVFFTESKKEPLAQWSFFEGDDGKPKLIAPITINEAVVRLFSSVFGELPSAINTA